MTLRLLLDSGFEVVRTTGDIDLAPFWQNDCDGSP